MRSPHLSPTPTPGSKLPARPSTLDPRRLPFSYLLAAISCALLCAATASATTVTLQGGFGYPKATAPDGSALADGHKVSIGTFPADFDPSTADLPAILANWKQFAFTTTATLLDDPGSFWLQHSNITGTGPENFSFPGKKIYLLLTRTDAAYSEPAADGSNVRDFALFTSNHTAWSFRQPPSETNLPPGDLSALNTSQITNAIAGVADAATGTFKLAFYSADPAPENPGDGSTPDSAFDQWLTATFPGHTATCVVGPSGLTALATFALAADPQATAPPYEIIEVDGRRGIQFTRKTTASGFETTAQASLDLSGWNLDIEEFVIAADSVAGTETVQAFPIFPADADQAKAFFRISVQPYISGGIVPAPEPTPEPTPEATPEPTPEPTPAPTPEPTPESTPEATPEPTPEPAPESTPEESPTPTQEG